MFSIRQNLAESWTMFIPSVLINNPCTLKVHFIVLGKKL